MFCPICRLPILRRLRATLSRLFALGVLLALAGWSPGGSRIAFTHTITTEKGPAWSH